MINTDKTEQDRLFKWKKYKMDIDIYKFHMDIVIKFNLLLYGITGAIVGYYFNISTPGRHWMLFPPIIVNLVFAGGHFYAGHLVSHRKRAVANLATELDIPSPPYLKLLQVVVWGLASVSLIVAVALAALFAVKQWP